jgi:hypothetical protein
MSDTTEPPEDELNPGAVARNSDPATSWLAADRVGRGKLTRLWYNQLYNAGTRGKTTMAMARDTGVPRDSFSPRATQNPHLVDIIGTRIEPNEGGRPSKFTVYRLKRFRPEYRGPIPLLLGWQMKRKPNGNGNGDGNGHN